MRLIQLPAFAGSCLGAGGAREGVLAAVRTGALVAGAFAGPLLAADRGGGRAVVFGLGVEFGVRPAGLVGAFAGAFAGALAGALGAGRGVVLGGALADIVWDSLRMGYVQFECVSQKFM